MSMSPAGTKLCVAGTMDDYATVVDREPFRRAAPQGRQASPTGSTPSGDGKDCEISGSGSRPVSGSTSPPGGSRGVAVGDHPQRIRSGFLAEGYLRHLR